MSDAYNLASKARNIGITMNDISMNPEMREVENNHLLMNARIQIYSTSSRAKRLPGIYLRARHAATQRGCQSHAGCSCRGDRSGERVGIRSSNQNIKFLRAPSLRESFRQKNGQYFCAGAPHPTNCDVFRAWFSYSTYCISCIHLFCRMQTLVF